MAASILSISTMTSSVDLLHLFGRALAFVFADLVVFFELLEHVETIAPHMPHRNLGGLGIFVRNLDQVLATIFVQFRDAQAQHLAVGRRRQPEIGRMDRLFHGMDHGLVPDLHRDQARLRYAHGGDLIERHVRAIGFDLDRLEQIGRRTAGAQTAEFLLQNLDRALHAALEFIHVMCRSCHDDPLKARGGN